MLSNNISYVDLTIHKNPFDLNEASYGYFIMCLVNKISIFAKNININFIDPKSKAPSLSRVDFV